MTDTQRRWLAGGIVVLILVVLAGLIGYEIHSTSAPLPKNAAVLQCQPDPAAAIAATPAGGTWTGTGCYDTAGILIDHPMTLDGGTFYDSVNTAPIKPIIRVEDTSDVTVENVSLNGVNPSGYHAALVGEAGIDAISVSGITISNVQTNSTYGDGLTLFFSDKGRAPDTNVVVNGLTVTNAGRQGITPADVTNGTFTNVHVVSSADDSIDMESDLKGIRDGTLTFANFTAPKLINIIEGVTSVTFTNSSAGSLIVAGGVGATVNYQGQFVCQRRAKIHACVYVTNGVLNLNATFSYLSGKNTPTEPFTLVKLPGVIVGT
jgi:hypothetical protein